ncbi:MAG: HpcH/HpaI aldolase/citrate lyase family protein [Enterocloster sp.]
MDEKRRKLANHETLFGTHILNDDLVTSHLIALCGFDYIWIDMEHTELDKHAVNNLLISCRAEGSTSLKFVRVPKNDPDEVKPILDMGADGIIFPMIRTRADVDRAIASCYYPPEGVRGFSPKAAVHYGMDDTAEYIRSSGDRLWKLIQIETKEAVENLDDILGNEKVDVFIIGPMDLSGSYGHLSDYRHPEVLGPIKRSIQKIHEAGRWVAVSVGAYDADTITFWSGLGVDMISAGSECGYILNGCRQTLNNMKTAFQKKK